MGWQRIAAFSLLLVIAGTLTACKKGNPRLSVEQIHGITREFAAAASAGPSLGTTVKTAERNSVPQKEALDFVFITLRADQATDAGRAGLATLLQNLEAVAVRHRLTQDESVRLENGLKLTFRQSGIPTQTIEIHFAAATPATKAGGVARLAIILDDLGNDRAAADAIFALHSPLTISVLPNHPHSIDIAEEARRHNVQVMLHLPMQSVANEHAEAKELRPGMPVEDVTRLLDEFIKAVPNAAGVNNHQGSQATADVALMSELMPALRDRHLFYVDSRTTAATVAFDTAQREGVRSAYRNVPFLDDVAQVAAVRKQLELAIHGARAKGEAIAIGHPHSATLQALKEVLPRLESQGVRLVYASDLVH